MKHANILIVEDDQDIQDMLSFSLEPEGYTIYSAYTVKDGWEAIEVNPLTLFYWIGCCQITVVLICCIALENTILHYRLL